MDNEKIYVMIEARPETKLEAGMRKVETALAVGGIIVTVVPILVYAGKWCIDTIAYKRKIKKGLKDGSIVEIDGLYYETVIEKSND